MSVYLALALYVQNPSWIQEDTVPKGSLVLADSPMQCQGRLKCLVSRRRTSRRPGSPGRRSHRKEKGGDLCPHPGTCLIHDFPFCMQVTPSPAQPSPGRLVPCRAPNPPEWAMTSSSRQLINGRSPRAHVHFLICCLQSSQEAGEGNIMLTRQPRHCKRLLETLNLNPERALGQRLQMLATWPQSEGTPMVGRGDAADRVTASTGTCLPVFVQGGVRGSPKEEEVWGTGPKC